ncbi:hypothetical protein C8R44DRAFT_732750 [Mycena epipterygia]|nr:hypothetical protein C8R44DRAFT_732750 [Mycena epipterygia]
MYEGAFLRLPPGAGMGNDGINSSINFPVRRRYREERRIHPYISPPHLEFNDVLIHEILQLERPNPVEALIAVSLRVNPGIHTQRLAQLRHTIVELVPENEREWRTHFTPMARGGARFSTPVRSAMAHGAGTLHERRTLLVALGISRWNIVRVRQCALVAFENARYHPFHAFEPAGTTTRWRCGGGLVRVWIIAHGADGDDDGAGGTDAEHAAGLEVHALGALGVHFCAFRRRGECGGEWHDGRDQTELSEGDIQDRAVYGGRTGADIDALGGASRRRGASARDRAG